MKELRIRKMSQEDLMRLNSLAKLKGYSSREAYVRQLIHRHINEEIELYSNEQYLDLVQQLLIYLSIQSQRIEEHSELMRALVHRKSDG